MPKAGCDLKTYQHKLMNTFGLYSTDIEIEEIYVYNEKLLTE